jgi:hypothetical protein
MYEKYIFLLKINKYIIRPLYIRELVFPNNSRYLYLFFHKKGKNYFTVHYSHMAKLFLKSGSLARDVCGLQYFTLYLYYCEFSLISVVRSKSDDSDLTSVTVPRIYYSVVKSTFLKCYSMLHLMNLDREAFNCCYSAIYITAETRIRCRQNFSYIVPPVVRLL